MIKKQIIRLNVVFIFVSLFIRCIKNVDISYPNFQSQKVLVGVLDSNQPISIRLSKTLPILSKDDSVYPPITNAKVVCYENGILLGQLLHKEDGVYVLPKFPKSGNIYQIQATVDSGVIMAIDTVPSMVDFRVEITNDNKQNINYNPDFKLTIERQSKKFNWFSISYYHKVRSKISLTHHPFYSESIYLDSFNSIKASNGKTLHSLNIRVKPYYKGKIEIEGVPGNQFDKDSSLYVQFLDVSYNYDRYLKSAIVAWQNRVTNNDGGLNNPFYEPVPIYSNVTGGIGILGSVQTRVVSIKRPK